MLNKDKVMSEAVKKRLRLACKKRSEKYPPWNKGLKVIIAKDSRPKSCGIKYMMSRNWVPLPIVFHGMNTAPSA